MKIRKTLLADEGKVLTNGTIYGKRIYLAEGLDESNFHEITDAEYAKLQEEMQEREQR